MEILLQIKKELIAFGDGIFPGIYIIHSKFKNSINFYNGERLVTIGNKNIGAGPSNIVFKEIDIENIKRLEIFKDSFYLNNNEFKIEKDKIYSSKLELKNFDLKKFYTNLEIFEKYLKLFSLNKGLIPLLEEDKEKKEKFMNSFIKRIDEGINALLNGSVIEGIKKIKGVGIGLTPSGDDFINGMLSGLTVLEKIKDKDYKNLKKIIYENAKGENLISNNFLYFASEGKFFERAKKLILSIFYGNEGEIVESTLSILQIGETSGVDFSTGFLWLVKKGGLNGCKRFN